VDPSRALFIGGGQGSGKSSIAWALSRRHGLQLYNVDHRTQVHLARHRPHRFFELSEDERWVYPEVETMLEWFIETSRDRLRIVLEDLADLPDEPGAIVEGPQLFPSFVAGVVRHPDQALFLVARPEEQRERLLARGPIRRTSQPVVARRKATERDLLIAARVEAEANALGLTALVADRPLDAMIEAADKTLAPALARLPRGRDLAAARRRENAAIVEQVRLFRATGQAPVPYPPLRFACECGRLGCAETVDLDLDAAEVVPIVAAGCTRSRRPTP
jgi:dephospho-CoA kinase